MEVPPLRPNYLPKAPIPKTTTLGLGFQQYEFVGGRAEAGDTNIQCIATSIQTFLQDEIINGLLGITLCAFS